MKSKDVQREHRRRSSEMKRGLQTCFLLGKPLCQRVLGGQVQCADHWGVSVMDRAVQQHCGSILWLLVSSHEGPTHSVYLLLPLLSKMNFCTVGRAGAELSHTEPRKWSQMSQQLSMHPDSHHPQSNHEVGGTRWRHLKIGPAPQWSGASWASAALRCLGRILSAWSQDMGVAVLQGSEALWHPNFDRGWMKLKQTAWTSSTSHSQLLVFNTACYRGKCVGVCVGSVLRMGSTEQSVCGEISTFPHITTEERKCPYEDETNPNTTLPPTPPHTI